MNEQYIAGLQRARQILGQCDIIAEADHWIEKEIQKAQAEQLAEYLEGHGVGPRTKIKRREEER